MSNSAHISSCTLKVKHQNEETIRKKHLSGGGRVSNLCCQIFVIYFKIKQPCVRIYTSIQLIPKNNGTNFIFHVCSPWCECFWHHVIVRWNDLQVTHNRRPATCCLTVFFASCNEIKQTLVSRSRQGWRLHSPLVFSCGWIGPVNPHRLSMRLLWSGHLAGQ